jgi:HlyD family secretion protein
MDIARHVNVRRKRLRQAGYVAAGLLVVVGGTLGLSRLKPAAPTVDRASVWIDTVKRGPMVRNVRGLGTLVPEDVRWIPATTEARVEQIVLRPGTTVTADSVILELSNPQLDQELQDAQLKLSAAEAVLANLRVQVQNDYLQQKAATASIDADYNKAKMTLETKQALAEKQLAPLFEVRQSQVDADQLKIRSEIARQQLATYEESTKARLAVQQSEVDQAHAVAQLKRRQHDELRVRAGLAGVLQVVPVDVGQQVMPGTNLARVANPSRLKAEIKIAETQAKDLQIGQRAEVDTRNGVVQGLVARIDPSVQNGTRTVDVTLTGELPKGAVPDLSVDGTIELERLADVVFVGRPASGQEQAVGTLFKLVGGASDTGAGEAVRVQVRFGKSAVNTVEVVSGLSPGDRVVLSDMSAWDAYDRVRLQ